MNATILIFKLKLFSKKISGLECNLLANANDVDTFINMLCDAEVATKHTSYSDFFRQMTYEVINTNNDLISKIAIAIGYLKAYLKYRKFYKGR